MDCQLRIVNKDVNVNVLNTMFNAVERNQSVICPITQSINIKILSMKYEAATEKGEDVLLIDMDISLG